MNKCVIFAGGEFDKTLPDNIQNSFVICADKGYEYAKQLKITPNLIIGDFDSAKLPDFVNVKKFPKEKDDTDLMLAIKESIALGYLDITVCCGFGGRLDHTIGNIQAMAYITAHGGIGRMLSANEELSLITPGKYYFKNKNGFSLSIFSYTEESKGITIKGTKYTLENGSLKQSFPLGISNEIVDEQCEISFTDGLLIVIRSKIL